MRTFEFSEGASNKFWNIELKGTSFTVTFGKIGSKGQTQVKDFADEAKARKAYDKLVAEKTGKGYVETTGGGGSAQPAAAATPLQRSLEDALAENPDDLASHSAYADFLMEQNDPRGEFIQTQLALEDATRPAEERKRLREREAELLKKHAKRWLGGLGKFLVGKWSGPDRPWNYHFVRGWIDSVRMLPFLDTITGVLAKSPEVRLLRQLEIVYDMRYHPFDFDQFLEGPNKALPEDDQIDVEDFYEGSGSHLPALADSPHLSNLRVFRYGFSDAPDRIGHSTMVDPFGTTTSASLIQLLGKCPDLRELYLNAHMADVEKLFASPALGGLRVLQYYYGCDYYGSPQGYTAYPLAALAANESLGDLTTLKLHPGRDATVDLASLQALLASRNLPNLEHLSVHMTTFGNEGVRAVLDSGILKRLRTLDLGYGDITDEGARLLAANKDLKRLESLTLTRNALTGAGIQALTATGVPLVADDQHEPGDTEYLYMVDFE